MIATRRAAADFEGASYAPDQYTFGISKFVVGHKLKVQTDVSFLDIQGETDILLYRLQVDLHF